MKLPKNNPCLASFLRISAVSVILLCLSYICYAETRASHQFVAPPRVPLAEDGIHDPLNDAIKTLQNPMESMIDFPKDRRGEVDWVRAFEIGKISPRKSKSDDPWEEEIYQTMDLDIIMKNTAEMPYVKFPHLAHTKWLACSNCHPNIFIPRENANPINMEKVLKGKYCGVCHDKVSFSLYICERCHSIPHKGSGPAWW